MYRIAIMNNSFIKINPEEALVNAQQSYNETAIKEILSLNTKEGKFLLNGVSIGNSKEVAPDIHNTIQCTLDKDGNTLMKKSIKTGYDSIYGELRSDDSIVKNEDLPSLINGFKFIDGGKACNPCVALNDSADYSCPFSLNIGDETETKISPIWKKLWGI